jgi:hypothetical protein
MEEFINYWKSINFNNVKWNEADVREEFIAPLLIFLGYSKNTVNRVLREESLRLNNCFHRIGRKNIQIDYLPTVKLRKFWIIEAKPADPAEMNFGDFLQAHLYAIHPEIQAPYVVLTNGREIRIYESLNASSWEDTFLVSNQDDCEATFPRVFDFLCSKTILASIRKQTLKTVKDSLSVELDSRVAEDFQRDFNETIREARKVIENNKREFQRKAWKEREDREKKELEEANFEKLMILMDIPIDGRPLYGREIVRRMQNATKEERQSMANQLAMKYRGRPYQVFRVHCADAFARMYFLDIEVEKSLYVKSTLECLEELVSSNMNYWAFSELSNGLIHLENACHRLSYKLCRRFMMSALENVVQKRKSFLAIEEQLKGEPTVAREMIGSVSWFSEFLWRQFSWASDATELWKVIWSLEYIEGFLDKIPEPKYPDHDSDLLWFNHYGRGFDMLRIGTWDVLGRGKNHFGEKKLPESILKVLAMSREEVLKSYPSGKVPPSDWKPDVNILNSAFLPLVRREKG